MTITDITRDIQGQLVSTKSADEYIMLLEDIRRISHKQAANPNKSRRSQEAYRVIRGLVEIAIDDYVREATR